MNDILKLPWYPIRFMLRKIAKRIREPASPPAPVVAQPDPPPPAVVHTPDLTRPPVTVYQEDTPNPNAMKFTASIPVVKSGALSFKSDGPKADHPLGSALMEIDGVDIVFAVNDFVTVTKRADVPWHELSPDVAETIAQVLTASGTLPGMA